MTQGICVIVSGGRDYNEAERIWNLLDRLHKARGIDLICTGACKYGGADLHAENWAKSREVDYVGLPAKFGRGGPKEGPKRNRRMIETCDPDLALCFPGGKGTASLMREAKKAGVWTVDLSKNYKIEKGRLMRLGTESPAREEQKDV